VIWRRNRSNGTKAQVVWETIPLIPGQIPEIPDWEYQSAMSAKRSLNLHREKGLWRLRDGLGALERIDRRSEAVGGRIAPVAKFDH
jgi:hypothetical protein